MASSPYDIRIAQFLRLRMRKSSDRSSFTTHRYQNYFVNEKKQYPATNGKQYNFAPFRAEGTVVTTTGDNPILQVLFPNVEFAVQLLHEGDGNRLSRLELITVWLLADNSYSTNTTVENYVGLGASISETTIELRFRSAIDSVGSTFPGRVLTYQNVGPLPLDAQLRLQ